MSNKHKTTISDFKVFVAATNLGGEGKVLIITHQDIDGVVSSALLMKTFGTKYKQVDIVLTQPYWSSALLKFLTKGNRINKYLGVAFLDTSVDYANPKASAVLFDFLQHSGKLLYLFDHHAGWNRLLSRTEVRKEFNVLIDDEVHQVGTMLGRKIVIGNEACCAKLIYDAFPEIQDSASNYIMRIAAISDDLIIRQELKNTPEYTMFSQLKSLRLGDALEQILTKPDLVGLMDRGTDWVQVNNDFADTVLLKVQEVYPGIGYLSSLGDHEANYTAVFEQAYQRFKILIIKDVDPKHFRLSFKIGHCVPDVDLTQIFHLKGGNPKRVTIYGRRLTVADIVTKLSPYVDALNIERGISMMSSL